MRQPPAPQAIRERAVRAQRGVAAAQLPARQVPSAERGGERSARPCRRPSDGAQAASAKTASDRPSAATNAFAAVAIPDGVGARVRRSSTGARAPVRGGERAVAGRSGSAAVERRAEECPEHGGHASSQLRVERHALRVSVQTVRGCGAWSILGSTGSIGTQALDVVERARASSSSSASARQRSGRRSSQQARAARRRAGSRWPTATPRARAARGLTDGEVLAGARGARAARRSSPAPTSSSTRSSARPGWARRSRRSARASTSRSPTRSRSGRRRRARDRSSPRRPGAQIIPVDSEHSALHQLIGGERAGHGRQARADGQSGGPFRGRTRDELEDVTRRGGARAPDLGDGRQDHDRLGDADEQGPRADRGPPPVRRRRTSASTSSSTRSRSSTRCVDARATAPTLAHLGYPDMRVPIAYALHHPDRVDVAGAARSTWPRSDALTFEPPTRTRSRACGSRARRATPAAPRRACSTPPTRSRCTPSSTAGCGFLRHPGGDRAHARAPCRSPCARSNRSTSRSRRARVCPGDRRARLTRIRISSLASQARRQAGRRDQGAALCRARWPPRHVALSVLAFHVWFTASISSHAADDGSCSTACSSRPTPV